MSKWNIKKLGDIGEGYIGLTYSPSDVSDSGTIVLRSGNIQDGKLTFSDVVRVNKKISEKLIVRDGDILICSRNGSANLVGKSAFITNLDEKMTFGAFMMIYKSEYNPFLIHFFHSPYFKRQLSKSATTTINQITKKMLDDIEVPFPPLETQKQIAKTLDTAAEVLALRKQQLPELDSLIKSTFYHMFGDPVTNEKGWQVVSCKESVDILTGYPFKSEEYSNDNTQFKLCGGLIIMPDKIEWEKCNYWPNSKAIGLKRYELNEDDIVLAMDRPWISSGLKIGMINKANLPSLLIQRTARLRGISIEQLFLYYLFKDRSFKNHCKPTETTVPHISINDINSFNLILPPPYLQIQFAEIVIKIEAQKNLVKKAIEQTQYLFDSLMSQYFD